MLVTLRTTARAFHARKFHGPEIYWRCPSLWLHPHHRDNDSRDVDVWLRYTRSCKAGLCLGASMYKCLKCQLQSVQSATQLEPISQDRAGPPAGWYSTHTPRLHQTVGSRRRDHVLLRKSTLRHDRNRSWTCANGQDQCWSKASWRSANNENFTLATIKNRSG